MYPNDNIKCISEFLFIETEIPKVDLTLVLGHNWIPTMDEVYKKYIQGLTNKILITGHSPNQDKEPELERFYQRAIELGMNPNDLILEKEATNTKENFENCFPIIEKQIDFSNINKILIVCLSFHTRRALMSAYKYFPNHINYYFLPIMDSRNIKKSNWWQDEVATTRILNELGRISEYALKGDISL